MMRMIPPRNLREEEPVAVEERMGAGMVDHRVHHHGSLKDERPSLQDPLKEIPDDDVSKVMGLPSSTIRDIISGKVVDVDMKETGAHVEVCDGRRSVCAFIKGSVIIEKGMAVRLVAHFQPGNSGIVQSVSLERGEDDEGLS